jgi:hypothetical protein
MQSYSLEAVLTTATITFIFSGVLGALFKDWLDRAKPRMAVTSFGFCGGEEPIQIPPELQTLTDVCGWTHQLHRYEKYEKLITLARRVRRNKERLKLGQSAADKWLSDNRTWEHEKTIQATVDELHKCPFFADPVIGSTIFGAAKRGEIPRLPVPVEDLEDTESVTELSEAENGWHLYMQKLNVLIPTGDAKGETERNALLAVGISLSRGCKANVFHYLREFRRHAVEDTNQLSDIHDRLEQLLLPASRIAVVTVIANDGAKPITVRPHGKLVFHNKEIAEYSPLLQIQPDDSGGEKKPEGLAALLSAASQEDSGDDGDEVLVDELFPTVGLTSQRFIAPRSSIEVRMVSNETLGDAAERVLSMYRASVLQCSVALIDSSGNQMNSPAVLFGSSASKEDMKALAVQPA